MLVMAVIAIGIGICSASGEYLASQLFGLAPTVSPGGCTAMAVMTSCRRLPVICPRGVLRTL